tara:strand:- start:1325 stop:2059 length:735 start_codon:yes stop_codon:yes gene_type:complete
MNSNLSDQDFFDFYVKDEKWFPLQNHGLVDEGIQLKEDDFDFPYQITSYLNLFKDNNIKNKSILDIGCGWGRGTYTLKKYFPKNKVIGIDCNQSFIAYAKANYKGPYYFKDDFYKTKLKLNSFDYIVLNCCMHFFYNQDIIYENLKKLLKPNGKIIITDIWTEESVNIFLAKIKLHKLKVELKEDLSEKTINSMHYDIFNTFISHWRYVKDVSIYAFLRIQRDRLKLFNDNINKQYKFIIKNEL